MNKFPTNSDEKIVSSMQEMTIKSPQSQFMPRCARLSWSTFGQYNQSIIEEPKTPMGKPTLTSPPTTPKNK